MNSNPASTTNLSGASGATEVVPASSPTFSPLYQQIKALITQGLESGEWKPGEMIPSEVELAARYKVSQGTVRKADTGEILFDRSGDVYSRTASVMKILTSSAALAVLGPDYRVSTTVVAPLSVRTGIALRPATVAGEPFISTAYSLVAIFTVPMSRGAAVSGSSPNSLMNICRSASVTGEGGAGPTAVGLSPTS